MIKVLIVFKKAEHLLPFDVIIINVDFSFVHTNKSQKKIV